MNSDNRTWKIDKVQKCADCEDEMKGRWEGRGAVNVRQEGWRKRVINKYVLGRNRMLKSAGVSRWGWVCSHCPDWLVLVCILICRDSSTFLFVWCSSNITFAASQSTLWLLVSACTAMPFLVSLVLTAYLRSFSLISRDLPVSPHTHSCILHTGPHGLLLVLLSGGFYLHQCLRLFCDLQMTLIPRGWHTRSIFSLTPFMYGMNSRSSPSSFGVSSSSCTDCFVL